MLFLLILWIVYHDAAPLQTCTTLSCPPVSEKTNINLGTQDQDLPTKLLGRENINGCTCRELPHVYTLCFNANAERGYTKPCTKFPKYAKPTTHYLLLKASFVKELIYGDFDNIKHLHILTLDGNQDLHHIDPYIFENMKNLTSLTFIFNPSLTYLQPNIFVGLDNLKELNLLKNGFDDIKMLSTTLRPMILPNLYRLNLKDNIFKIVSEDVFQPMEGSSLRELDMVHCSIEYIHPKALEPLNNLAALRLGENRFDHDILLDLLKGTLESGIDLKLLDLYSSGFRASVPWSLLHEISRSNITSLYLGKNQFDILDNETFPILMPNLNLLDLTDVSAQNIDDQAFSNLPNLERLIMTENRLSYFPASKHLPNLTCLDMNKNTDSYGWEFFLTRSEFFRMKLEYLNLEFTKLIYLTKYDLGYMPYLRSLNLRNCSIFRFANETFKGLTNLKCLNLENNRFFVPWMQFRFDVFEGLENLEILLLGGNEITALSKSDAYMLKYLIRIKRLGLDRNKLQTISAKDFAPLLDLEVLDISNNYLLIWEDRVFLNHNLREFYGSNNKIVYLSDAMLADFQNLTHLDIDYNSFVCNCQFKVKITAIAAAARLLNVLREREVWCLKPSNITVADFIESIVDSSLNCDEKVNALVFIIPFVIFAVIGIIIGILSYIYRWHIRYWAFLVRLYLTRKGKIRRTAQKGYTNHEFDAFVSYCNQDRNFVIRLVRMLENNEPYLKLCVYERDFQVGTLISESVLEHINKSRKTLLIVSDSYAKSYWCNWETQIAEHHRLFIENDDCIDESIVLIKLGSINETQLNPTLKYLLKTRIYLQWDSEIEEQQIFWQKLRQFLSSPNNDIEENTHL